jgi:tRNA(adenine34) deaminase
MMLHRRTSVADGDRAYLSRALELARAAAAQGEVPVGALVVRDGVVLGRGSNRPVRTADPTAHAEIVALREAGASVGNYRLPGSTMYVTLEPCLMCFGAAIHARVERLVFGALDPRIGAASLVRTAPEWLAGLNHRIQIEGGILADESAAVLRQFFGNRRHGQAQAPAA